MKKYQKQFYVQIVCLVVLCLTMIIGGAYIFRESVRASSPAITYGVKEIWKGYREKTLAKDIDDWAGVETSSVSE